MQIQKLSSIYDYGLNEIHPLSNCYNNNSDDKIIQTSFSQEKPELYSDRNQIKDIQNTSFSNIKTNITNREISILDHNDDDEKVLVTESYYQNSHIISAAMKFSTDKFANEHDKIFHGKSSSLSYPSSSSSSCLIKNNNELYSLKDEDLLLFENTITKNSNNPLEKINKMLEEHRRKKVLANKTAYHDKENLSYLANQIKGPLGKGSRELHNLDQKYSTGNLTFGNPKPRYDSLKEEIQAQNSISEFKKSNENTSKETSICENNSLIENHSSSIKDFNEESSTARRINTQNYLKMISESLNRSEQLINDNICQVDTPQFQCNFHTLEKDNKSRFCNAESKNDHDLQNGLIEEELSNKTLNSSLSDQEFDLSRSDKDISYHLDCSDKKAPNKTILNEAKDSNSSNVQANFYTEINEKGAYFMEKHEGSSKTNEEESIQYNINNSNTSYTHENLTNNPPLYDKNNDYSTILKIQSNQQNLKFTINTNSVENCSPKFDNLSPIKIRSGKNEKLKEIVKNYPLAKGKNPGQKLNKYILNCNGLANVPEHSLESERTNGISSLRSSKSATEASAAVIAGVSSSGGHNSNLSKHVFVKINDENNLISQASLKTQIYENLIKKRNQAANENSKPQITDKKTKSDRLTRDFSLHKQQKSDEISRSSINEPKNNKNKQFSQIMTEPESTDPNLSQASLNNQSINLPELDQTLLKIESNLKMIQHEKMLLNERRNLFRDKSTTNNNIKDNNYSLHSNPKKSVSNERKNHTNSMKNEKIANKSINDNKSQNHDEIKNQMHESSLSYNQSSIHGKSTDDFKNMIDFDSSRINHKQSKFESNPQGFNSVDISSTKRHFSSSFDLNNSHILRKMLISKTEESITQNNKFFSTDGINRNGSVISSSDDHKKSWTDLSLYDRNKIWLIAKKARVNELQHGQNQVELRECTFHPNIKARYLASSMMGSSSSSLIKERASLSSSRLITKSSHNRFRSLSHEKKQSDSYSKFYDLKRKFDYCKDNSFSKQLSNSTNHETNNRKTHSKSRSMDKSFNNTIKISKMLKKFEKKQRNTRKKDKEISLTNYLIHEYD